PSREYEVGESLTLPALIADHHVGLLRPLEVEVRVAVPREADATMDLDVLAGDEDGGLAHVALRHGNGRLAPRVVDVRRPRRVVRPDSRELDALQHVDGLV